MKQLINRQAFLAHGNEVAAALAGSWRRVPLPVGPGETPPRESLVYFVEQGLSGMLAHRHGTALAALGEAGEEINQSYRWNRLQAAVHHSHLVELVARFRQESIEPILCKGWSAARLYPEPGMRPYGDIDLCVAPDEIPKAARLLEDLNCRFGWVDLHRGLPDLGLRNWAAIKDRSILVPLGDAKIRILAPRDQIRHLCHHFWRHLGQRPMWLCDIAAVMEAMPQESFWEELATTRRGADAQVVAVVLLASQLLKARLPEPFSQPTFGPLPGWLSESVLWQWAAEMQPAPIPFDWRARADHWLYTRLNPYRAVLRTGMSPRNSQWAIQAASLCQRPYQLGVRIARSIAKCRHQEETPFDLHEQRRY